MKIQIDTIKKTVIIQESIRIDEFYKIIKKFLPNDLWKEFTLETYKIKDWIKPVLIREHQLQMKPYPTTIEKLYKPYPWISCEVISMTPKNTITLGEYKLKSGRFNVDCKIK